MAVHHDLKSNTGDSHQTAPYWFAAFIRFKNRDTFTRTKLDGLDNQTVGALSASSDVDAMEELDPGHTLIADSDIIQWQTSASKSSHTSSLGMTLVNKDVDYVAAVAPGDWICFWAFNDKTNYLRVRKQVREDKKANDAADGLKFMGRVNNVRQTKSRQNNIIVIHYTIGCQGFSEFDSSVYYHPRLAEKYEAQGLQFFDNFTGNLNLLNLNKSVDGKSIFLSQDIVPVLVNTLFGLGPQNTQLMEDSGKGGVVNKEISPNEPYKIPAKILSWIPGIHAAPLKGQPHYVDLLRLYVGVQSYKESDDSKTLAGFVPILDPSRRLSGEFNKPIVNLNNVSMWSMITSYVNQPIDEIYTCLRIAEDNQILPSLIVRQTPLTTNFFASKFNDIPTTTFMSLPRWKLDDSLVNQVDVGRSEVMRHNWVRFHGSDLQNAFSNTEAIGDIFTPPVVDHKDIERSGLHMCDQPIAANVNAVDHLSGTGLKWQQIMSDIMMGGHLKYNGTIVCQGIQDPICHGDNLEYGDVVYHIESVSHSGSLAPSGLRNFSTTIQVTNGISIFNDDSKGDEEILYADTDLSIAHLDDQAQTIEEDDGR